MLHIILGILKIIGIILIVLIGTILLILALVLFFPVGYQAKGEKYDDEITAKAKIYWLFHLVAFHISYENREFNTRLRILGIPVDFINKNNNKEKKVHKKKKEDKNKRLVKENDSKDKELDKKPNEETVKKIKDKERVEKKREEINKGYSKEIYKEVREDNDKVENSNDYKTKQNPIINFLKKLAVQIKKIFSNIKNIKFTFEKIYDKIISGKEKAVKITQFLKDENNKAGFKNIKRQFLVLWKHIKPRKLQLEARFGTGEPETTGQLLGIISIAYPFFQNHCKITPNFEEQVFEGNLFLKGRFQACVLVWIAFTLYRDKNIKKMINQLGIIRRK